MATVALIEYENASPEVRAVFDDIKRTRNVPDVNNFWKALANHPETLKRTWETLQRSDAAGRARSAHQGDDLRRRVGGEQLRLLHPLAHGGGPRQGMTDAQHQELLAVIGMASQTNALSTALKVPVDPQFLVD